MPRNWKSLNASKKKEKEEAEKKSVLRKSSRSSREQPSRSKEEAAAIAKTDTNENTESTSTSEREWLSRVDPTKLPRAYPATTLFVKHPPRRPFFFDSSTEGQSSGTVFPDAPSMPKSFGAKDSKLPEREKSLERLEPLEIGRYAAS
uniref:Uncharacterized protein n=1 Tax=Vespula pensylvanica TaxID=30213 RepID=A0A834PCU8_VESPE|nr:hypothetical protein H0235_004140 [Vespula pensylvanica]